jgi:putative Mn2+ efflux pump MntP
MREINRRTLGKREKNMVLFIEILLIGVGLSMDAFAVSICKGLGMTKVNRKQALTIGLYFGGFQALMPFIGYMLGIRFEKYITSIDHWIAFILLGFIGSKMVYEAVKEKDDDAVVEKDLALNQGEMLLLAIATSIDALAVGIMFAFTYDSLNIYWAIAIIGLTTFVLSIIGVIVGNFFGNKYKKKSEIAGGIILILIGVKILLEHLGIISF